MRKPTISVCIVTYNSADFIVETLDSVANQTLKDYEIVLSDDGSKDDTVVKVREWKEQHPDILMTVIEKPKNEGTVRNCNSAYRVARADLIKDFAGDDILMPTALEDCYQAYLSNPDVIWQGLPRYVGENTEQIKMLQDNFDSQRVFFTKTQWQQHSYFLTSNPIISTATGLIPKTLCEKIGYFDTHYVLLEDYPFMEHISKAGVKFELLEKEVCEYRINGTSVTQSCNLVYEKDKVKHYFRELFPQLLKANRKGDAINYGKYYLRKYREAKAFAKKKQKDNK